MRELAVAFNLDGKAVVSSACTGRFFLIFIDGQDIGNSGLFVSLQLDSSVWLLDIVINKNIIFVKCINEIYIVHFCSMSSDFDPYRVWLSIPVSEQPANYYRLLGVELFESDDEVISNAADRQMSHVRTFQSGQFSELSQKILNELSAARVTLLNKKKKSKYDANLRSKLSASSEAKINETALMELPPPPPPSLTPSQLEVQPKTEVKTVKKLNVRALRTLFTFVLLSAMALELFVFIRFFRNYLSQQPTAAELVNAKAEELYNQSVQLEKEFNYSEAINKMTAAFELAPENEEYKTRERQLKKLENEKKTKGLYYQLIELEADQKYEKALFIINQICELAPGNKDYESERKRIKVLFEKNIAGIRKTFTVNGVEFVFRYCPPGTFMMGSPESEAGRYDNETQHQVKLTNGFWMMETEVTQKQWKAVMETNLSKFKGDNLPVESVSWDDCQEFCDKCTELGLPVQLPTEAQWEYACRAGSTTAYFWGNALNGDKANCDGSYPCGTTVKGEYLKKTTPVGSYAPNAWGLYDMHGNVEEWCQDRYSEEYPRGSVTDPTGSLSGVKRVYRGGNYFYNARYCRSAFRDGKDLEKYSITGFRYALSSSITGFRCALSSDFVSKSTKTEFSSSLDEKKKLVIQKSPPIIIKKAGDSKVVAVNGVEFAFKWCPAGAFMMGSPESEDGRKDDETQHQVKLTKGFWMMETEVSQRQWLAVMKNNPSQFKGDDLPVERVSWDDCQEFCNKCTELGLSVQLPTEAQWEYACRAGSTGAYAGSLDEMAWYASNSSNKTHLAGRKTPNAWGLYNMHGNVWEWCSDWYGDYPGGRAADPADSSNDSWRVCRGGCYSSLKADCRSANRYRHNPKHQINGLGFRCVLGQ